MISTALISTALISTALTPTVVTSTVVTSTVVTQTSPSPYTQGFRMPAEWAPHAATWTVWPRDDDYWFGFLEGVRQDFAAFVTTLARFEPVRVLVHDDEAEADARQRFHGAEFEGNISLYRVPNRDIWLRDTGPIFVQRSCGAWRSQAQSNPGLAAVNWEFNGWGQKFPWDLDNQIAPAILNLLDTQPLREQEIRQFDAGIVMEGGSIEVNGAGVGLTTRQCLLSPLRNPGMSETQLEQTLRDFLGIETVVWLEEGLVDDHTDGHIDTITRFVDERTLVTLVAEDPANPNHAVLQQNLQQLRQFRDAQGQGFQVIELPLTRTTQWLNGVMLPQSYANFYIANGAVLVPIFEDANDEQALAILRSLFPGREVIGLRAVDLVKGGGVFHCATQQQCQIIEPG